MIHLQRAWRSCAVCDVGRCRSTLQAETTHATEESQPDQTASLCPFVSQTRGNSDSSINVASQAPDNIYVNVT